MSTSDVRLRTTRNYDDMIREEKGEDQIPFITEGRQRIESLSRKDQPR